MRIFLILFLINTCLVFHNSKKAIAELFIPSRTANFWQYLNLCYPPSHKTFQNKLEYQKLLYLMENELAASVWIPFRKKDFKAWTWLDGSYYDHFQRTNEKKGGECGAIQVQNEFIDELQCNDILQCHVCSKKGNWCYGRKCFYHNGWTYFVFEKNLSWYMAKTHCHAKGLSLASLPTSDIQEVMQQLNNDFSNIKTCWIGLRRAEFLYHSKDSCEYNEILYDWDEAHPENCFECNCAALTLTRQDKFKWRSENCQRTLYYICEKVVNMSDFKDSRTSDQQINLTHWWNVSTPIHLLQALGILLIVTMAIYLTHLYRKRQQTKNSGCNSVESRMEVGENKEQEPLVQEEMEKPCKNNKKQNPQEPLYDKGNGKSYEENKETKLTKLLSSENAESYEENKEVKLMSSGQTYRDDSSTGSNGGKQEYYITALCRKKEEKKN